MTYKTLGKKHIGSDIGTSNLVPSVVNFGILDRNAFTYTSSSLSSISRNRQQMPVYRVYAFLRAPMRYLFDRLIVLLESLSQNFINVTYIISPFPIPVNSKGVDNYRKISVLSDMYRMHHNARKVYLVNGSFLKYKLR